MITFRDSSSFVKCYSFNLFYQRCRVVIESVMITQKIETNSSSNTPVHVLKPNENFI